MNIKGVVKNNRIIVSEDNGNFRIKNYTPNCERIFMLENLIEYCKLKKKEIDSFKLQYKKKRLRQLCIAFLGLFSFICLLSFKPISCFLLNFSFPVFFQVIIPLMGVGVVSGILTFLFSVSTGKKGKKKLESSEQDLRRIMDLQKRYEEELKECLSLQKENLSMVSFSDSVKKPDYAFVFDPNAIANCCVEYYDTSKEDNAGFIKKIRSKK